jgi:DNA polymerase
MKVCGKFLERQIDIIRPRVIIALGKFSAMYIKGLRDVAPEAFPISKYRGRFEKYKGADLMLTYHPSYLLRNQGAKKDVWEDLQQVMKLLGLQSPKRDKG